MGSDLKFELKDAARKAQEREAKKAEVRRRLEEAGQKKKAKKGFLTPERKKKLRVCGHLEYGKESFSEASHDQGR